MLRALGSASCDITHETGGTVSYGHWVLRLVISHLRQEVRFVTSIGFCGRSASCDITHKTRNTICYGNWVLRLGDITHRTGGTICYGHWVLPLVISHTRQGSICYGLWDLHLLISQKRRWGTTCCGQLGSASCDITHETGGTICSGHWVLPLVISHTRQGSICYGLWDLHLLISQKRRWGTTCCGQLGSASCDITHETGGTIWICSGHWVLPVAISHTRQGVRFVTGIGYCFL